MLNFSSQFLSAGYPSSFLLMPNYFPEPSKNIPIVQPHDVVVAGGGPAGIAAALAAARQGASTMLIEAHGSLGGVWTSGALAWVIDAGGKSGIMSEIFNRLLATGDCRAQEGQPANFSFDVEAMKLLLETLLLEAGVKIRLHTRVVAASRDSQNRLSVVLTESKSGREAWTAGCFVDEQAMVTLPHKRVAFLILGAQEAGNASP